MKTKFKAKVLEIGQLKELPNLQKQTIIVKGIGKYPVTTDIEFLGKNINKLKNIKVGDFALFICEIRCNKWNGMYLKNIICTDVKMKVKKAI